MQCPASEHARGGMHAAAVASTLAISQQPITSADVAAHASAATGHARAVPGHESSGRIVLLGAKPCELRLCETRARELRPCETPPTTTTTNRRRNPPLLDRERTVWLQVGLVWLAEIWVDAAVHIWVVFGECRSAQTYWEKWGWMPFPLLSCTNKCSFSA